jgi:Cu-Zn family superoxide dismutase
LLNGVRIPAGAAGGHFDPDNTGKHLGPMGEGHLGDLPVLEVANDGTASQTLTAPRIKDVAMLQGRSLMIHTGGDNYSDEPAPLGGGGSRLVCGIIPGKAE